MDLIRLLRSLEEFIYELVGWLVFYPRTFWRTLRRPASVAAYTQAQLALPLERQFADAVSPALMLLLSVLLAHVLELATGAPPVPLTTPLRRVLFGSVQGLILTRSGFFAALALSGSITSLMKQRRRVDRETLREPFSIQSYLVAVFAVLLSVAFLLARRPDATAHRAAWIVALGAIAWYLWARAGVYRAISGLGWARAFALVLPTFLGAAAIVLVVLVLV